MCTKTTVLTRLVIYLAAIFLSTFVPSVSAGEYPKSERDFKALPKYCRAKLQEGYATQDMHRRYSRGLKGIYGDSHHYCASMHSFQHADGLIPAKEPKKYWLGRVIDNIEYIENHSSNKTHKFYAEMYLLKARALLMQKQVGQAFLYFEKSLAVNPKYTPAYKEQIKYYRKLNDSKSALEVVNRGLQQKPNSKSLLRIKSELSGN